MKISCKALFLKTVSCNLPSTFTEHYLNAQKGGIPLFSEMETKHRYCLHQFFLSLGILYFKSSDISLLLTNPYSLTKRSKLGKKSLHITYPRNVYGTCCGEGGCGGYEGGKSAMEHAKEGLFDAAPTTQWMRGHSTPVFWWMHADHRGGYAYRLCKVSE